MDNNELIKAVTPPSSPYDKNDIAHALQVILATPDLLDKLIQEKEAAKTRRKNWSRLSRSSYYNKRYALELKAVIDDMLQTGRDMEYRCMDYPTLKPATIYLRINHAKLFIMDELDPDGVYKEVFTRIHIGYSPQRTGVRLTLLQVSNEKLVPVPISTDEKHDTWKTKLDDYVATVKPGDKALNLKGLSLTLDEVNTIKDSFITLEHLGILVTPTEILVRCFS